MISEPEYDLAGWRARLSPSRPAVHWRGRWLDYAELDARAEQLAARLAALGIGRGARIGILGANHIAHLDLILAAPKLGVIYTPFNHRLTAAEQAPLAQTIQPALLLHDAAQAAAAQAFDGPRVALEDYESWLAQPASAFARAQVSGEDPHMILFTGGSTGLPKGAVLPYRQTQRNAIDTILGWELRASDCVVQATPAFHAAVNVLATPLLHLGGRVVWEPQFEAGRHLAAVAEHGASLMFMVPTMYRALAEHPDFERCDLSTVRWAIAGGAPCPPALRERYRRRGIALRVGYGMTEVGVNCFATDDARAERHPDSVGRPLPSLRLRIERADGGECGVDEVGELLLAGPQVCLGYHRRDAETAASRSGAWFRSGDLASRDAEGNVFIRGRRKEMYISGGENVYPDEVEAAICALGGVRECAVLGVEHPHWGETGFAAVVVEDHADWDADRLRAALKTRLAGYKLPRAVLFLDELPKSGAGKILKPQLKQIYQQQMREEAQSP